MRMDEPTPEEIKAFQRQVAKTATAFVQPIAMMAAIAVDLEKKGYMQTAILQSMLQSIVPTIAALTETPLKQDQPHTDEAILQTINELLPLARKFREETGVCRSKEAPLQ